LVFPYSTPLIYDETTCIKRSRLSILSPSFEDEVKDTLGMFGSPSYSDFLSHLSNADLSFVEVRF
jgi:hypothetical protein